MKLGDIKLTDEQVAAFVRWLDEEMAAQRRTDDAEAAREAEMRENDERYEKVTNLARQTAEMHVPLVGVRTEDQARAAWMAFVESEGYFDRFDVDERFEPRPGDDYEEGWILAYSSVIEGKRRAQR